MKRTAIIVCFMVFLFIPFFASASDESLEEEIVKEAGSEKLTENSENASESLAETVFSLIRHSVSSFVDDGLKYYCCLLSLTVVLSVFSSFKWTSESRVMNNLYEYISILTLASFVFSSLSKVFVYASDSVNRLCLYMASLIPVTASLYTLGGNISTGVASSSSLILFLTLAERFSGVFLMPLLKAGFAASVIPSLPGSSDMRSVSGFLKNMLTTLLAFVFTTFGVVMYFQTVITASADNYAFRTVKFASGVFIPVIGNIVGEAARMVTASVSVVKASVGGAGIVAILSLTLPAVIYVFMYKLFTLLGAMTSRLLGLEKEAGLLYDVNGFLSVLVSLLVGTSVIFIIAAAMFIRIGVGD